MTASDVDQELERLFSAARRATLPEPGDKARIRAALEPRLAGGDIAAGLAPKRAAWFGIGAAVIGLSAVAVWLMNAPPRASVSPTTSAAPAPLPSSTPGALLDAAPLSELAPSASPARETPRPKMHPAPSPKVSSSTPPASQSADAAEELTLVQAMQQALRSGDAGHALTLAGEHGRRFPRGALVEEREGVRAVARCRLAAPGDRAPILDAFSRRFSASPYAARVRAACQ